MKVLILSFGGLMLLWVGIAFISPVWVQSPEWALATHWQFYVGIVFLGGAKDCFVEAGREKERRKAKFS